MNEMDSTRPTLDCQDRGILAFSPDSITHLSSAMRVGEETTSKRSRERGPLLRLHQRSASRRLLPGLVQPYLSGQRRGDGHGGCGHSGRGQLEPVDAELQAAHPAPSLLL